MDSLIQVWSDLRDLRQDVDSGLFRDCPWELEKRWSALAEKVSKTRMVVTLEHYVPANLD